MALPFGGEVLLFLVPLQECKAHTHCQRSVAASEPVPLMCVQKPEKQRQTSIAFHRRMHALVSPRGTSDGLRTTALPAATADRTGNNAKLNG
jgi:hypothetical protein